MDKEKYLKELEKRLDFLDEEQKQTEIFRISNAFDNQDKVQDLSTELDQIKEKYAKNYKQNQRAESLDAISNGLGQFYKNIKKNGFQKNLVIARDLILILLLVCVLKIPFLGLEALIFSALGNIISSTIYNIIYTIIELSYILFAVFIFIKLFKRRFKKELEN